MYHRNAFTEIYEDISDWTANPMKSRFQKHTQVTTKKLILQALFLSFYWFIFCTTAFFFLPWLKIVYENWFMDLQKIYKRPGHHNDSSMSGFEKSIILKEYCHQVLASCGEILLVWRVNSSQTHDFPSTPSAVNVCCWMSPGCVWTWLI